MKRLIYNALEPAHDLCRTIDWLLANADPSDILGFLLLLFGIMAIYLAL